MIKPLLLKKEIKIGNYFRVKMKDGEENYVQGKGFFDGKGQ